MAASWCADSVTYSLKLNGFGFYIILTDDPGFDSHPSEPGRCLNVAIRSSKMGSAMYGMLVALAQQVSNALEGGMDLDQVISSLLDLQYEPFGFVLGHPRVTQAKSFSDLLGQLLRDRYRGPSVSRVASAAQKKKLSLVR